jgi:hypothetical protein
MGVNQMAERRVTTKEEVLADIERAWRHLNGALERLTEEQMTARQDGQGWTVKDHIVHMAAWERSVVFLLQGKPRHEGLGVDEGLYLEGTEDEINAVIQQQRQGLSLAEALSQLRDVHEQMLELLQALTDVDLLRPYRHYLPEEPGEGDGPPAINLVYGNTADHFAEHQGWIEELAAEASPRPSSTYL